MIDMRKATKTMLKADNTVSALVGDCIYLIISKKDDGFPRIVIVEEANDPSYYSNGAWEGCCRLQLLIYAKTYDEFFALLSAVDDAMTNDRWTRKGVGADDYVADSNVYAKGLTYSKFKMIKPN